MSINEEKEVKEQKENIGIENEEKRNTGKWVKFNLFNQTNYFLFITFLCLQLLIIII